MTTLPVKGEILEWARKFRGLSENQAADLLGMSVAELKAYESEDKPVTIGIFEKFAAKYELPQATLFRSTKPEEPPKPQDFRTLEGRKPSDSFDFRIAVSNVRTLLSYYGRIATDDEDFRAPNLAFLSGHEDPYSAGESERKRIGITPQAQFSWPRNEAFRRWRVAMEMQGINVFQQKFPLKNCRGFTMYDSADAPAIVINKSEDSDVAKIFTLIHEYCHLLLRKPGISDENSTNPVESYCNKFAAAFLMPTDALRLLLPQWPNRPVAWDNDQIANWAARLKVSRMALALRLEQLGVAPNGFHKKFKTRRPRSEPRQSTNRVDPTVRRLSDIGGNYTKSVMDALDRGVIDEVHAAEALGFGEHNFEKARKAIRRNLELATGG
jgi:Zn-dependent peptidase ImmA (M78 family)